MSLKFVDPNVALRPGALWASNSGRGQLDVPLSVLFQIHVLAQVDGVSLWRAKLEGWTIACLDTQRKPTISCSTTNKMSKQKHPNGSGNFRESFMARSLAGSPLPYACHSRALWRPSPARLAPCAPGRSPSWARPPWSSPSEASAPDAPRTGESASARKQKPRAYAGVCFLRVLAGVGRFSSGCVFFRVGTLLCCGFQLKPKGTPFWGSLHKLKHPLGSVTCSLTLWWISWGVHVHVTWFPVRVYSL